MQTALAKTKECRSSVLYAQETLLNLYPPISGETFSYSYDGRNFNGHFPSRQLAIASAFDGMLNESFIFVGRNIAQPQEAFIPTSSDVLNIIARNIERQSPIAADACRSQFTRLPPEAEDMLEQQVKKIVSTFLSTQEIDIAINDIADVQKFDATSGELVWSEISPSECRP